ncbi:TPA: hypothetical protein ACGADT_004063 [Salmonella enterica subsp. enterica serovar Newport]
MKLSPEAKQAIKTAIEQLRLLLVDDAMDTVREEVSKHWMDDGKGDDEKITISGDCHIEGKLSAGKIDGDVERHERLKKTFIQLTKAAINEPDDKPVSEVVLEAPELKVSDNQAEKCPDEEALEVERVVSAIIRNADSSELLRQLSLLLTKPVLSSASISNGGQSAKLIQSANFHSFKRIYAELDKLTEEVKTLRSSNKKLKKRANTLEKWEKIHR